jgi:hypothetical protein
VARVHPGPAVHDDFLTALHSELVESIPKLLIGFESPVRAQVAGEWRAASARDVAGLGVDRLRLAAITLAGPLMEQSRAHQGANSLE